LSKAASATSSLGISEESVLQKTGRGWEAWYSLLDDFGVREQGHAAAARLLTDVHGLPGWWAQTITVSYERDRGLRQPGERADGKFEIFVRRTVPASAERAFAAISRAAEWDKWFTSGAQLDLEEGGIYRDNDGDQGTVIAVAPPRVLRLTWEHPDHGPPSIVEFQVESKGPDRCVVTISHEKVAGVEAYKSLKPGWQWAMDSLKHYLTVGKGMSETEWRLRKAGK
jgi:uncharacterized protein YndB with AHSA1/START domain